MIGAIKIFEVLLAFLYVMTALQYARDFIKPANSTPIICRIHVIGLLILHFLYLALISAYFQRNPSVNFYEFLSVLSFGLLVIYFYLEIRFQTRTLGPWIIGFAAVLEIIVAIFVKHPSLGPGEMDIFKSILFTFHMIFGAFAYSSLLISAVFSLMHLILYRALKQKKFGFFFERFLPLAVLNRMNYEAMLTGVVFLGLIIPIGLVMVFEHYGKWVWDFKYFSVFISFLIYLGGLIIGRYPAWKGNRLAFYSLSGLVLLFLTIGLSMFLSSYHRWL